MRSSAPWRSRFSPTYPGCSGLLPHPALRSSAPTALAVPNDVLREMYETGRATTIDGQSIGLHSVVAPEFANALYALVKRERPELVLEIGLAHGATALSIATALQKNGFGRLVSIDPFQQ